MVRYGTALFVMLALAAAGCTSYYIVKDPASGKTYFTNEIEEMRGGAVKLKDEKSGAVVTIQNSEIREVDSGEYKAKLNAPPPAPPPAPAPAVAPAPPPAPAAAPAPAPAEAPPAPAPAPTDNAAAPAK